MVCVNFTREIQHMGKRIFICLYNHVYTLTAATGLPALVNTENDTALIGMGSNVTETIAIHKECEWGEWSYNSWHSFIL